MSETVSAPGTMQTATAAARSRLFGPATGVAGRAGPRHSTHRCGLCVYGCVGGGGGGMLFSVFAQYKTAFGLCVLGSNVWEREYANLPG